MFVPIITLLVLTCDSFAAQETFHSENVKSLQAVNMNEATCQLNSVLNTLLVKMVLASQPQLMQQQNYQQFERTKVKTTLLTSSVVSTLTRRVPKVLTIWFRNERIPTTIFATTTQVVTDIVTATSVIGAEPTDLEHDVHRRQVTRIESSFPERQEASSGITATDVLETATISEELVSQILTQSIVNDAFANLVAAIQRAEDQVKKNHKSPKEI